MEENPRTAWTNIERILEDMRKIRSEKAWLYEGLRIVLPTKTFDENFTLDSVEMTHVGGHTADSSVVFMADDRVLFAGDLVFAETFSWGGDPSADPDSWIDALEMILDMDVETIIPGHGPVCDKSEIKIQLEWFEAVRDEMKRLIVEGASTEDAVKHDGYSDFHEAETDERRDETLRHWYRVGSKRN